MLAATDPVTRPPRRVIVAGASGAGKTTMSARVASVLGIRHVEIDALFHGPEWTPRPTFVGDVEAFSSGGAWVTEWSYSAARELLAERADTMIWLDLPTVVVMTRLVRRTLDRRLHRRVLWNGNVEPPLWTVLTDRDHIVRWGWRTRNKPADRVPELPRRFPGLQIVRLRSTAECDRWLADLERSQHG